MNVGRRCTAARVISELVDGPYGGYVACGGHARQRVVQVVTATVANGMMAGLGRKDDGERVGVGRWWG